MYAPIVSNPQLVKGVFLYTLHAASFWTVVIKRGCSRLDVGALDEFPAGGVDTGLPVDADVLLQMTNDTAGKVSASHRGQEPHGQPPPSPPLASSRAAGSVLS